MNEETVEDLKQRFPEVVESMELFNKLVDSTNLPVHMKEAIKDANSICMSMYSNAINGLIKDVIERAKNNWPAKEN